MALIPLSLWFFYAMLGLAGTSEVSALQYLAHPWNALLMGAFVVFSLYHAYLGLQVVIDDYIHTAGMKILLLLLRLLAVLLIGGVSTSLTATRRHYSGTETPTRKRIATASGGIAITVVLAGGLFALAWLHSGS